MVSLLSPAAAGVPFPWPLKGCSGFSLVKRRKDKHEDSYQETMGKIDKSVPKVQQLSLQLELRDNES